MGMTVSLIPTIVESFTLKKFDDVNRKINSSIKMILFVSVPMALGLSMLASSVWSVFYGVNETGAMILNLSVMVAITINLYMVSQSIIQGLNKFKTVYISTGVGFLINLILDVPIMLFFNKIGIQPYLGAAVASMFGYFSSTYIALHSIKRVHKMSYKDTYLTILKMVVPVSLLALTLVLIRMYIPYDVNNKLSCVNFIIINATLGGLVYIITSWKMGLIKDIIGDKLLDRIKKKLTRK